MKTKSEQMWENLSDPDFRKQFIDEHVDVGIAFQIRSLRNRQQLKQSDLGKLMNVKQPLVSSWENPDYGRYSLKTLKDLANAFDVGLLVRFVPFSKLIDWTVDLTSDVIAPPNFSEEQHHIPALISVASHPMGDTKDRDAYTLNFNEPAPIANAATATIERKGVLV